MGLMCCWSSGSSGIHAPMHDEAEYVEVRPKENNTFSVVSLSKRVPRRKLALIKSFLGPNEQLDFFVFISICLSPGAHIVRRVSASCASEFHSPEKLKQGKCG
jgi:hypothetical protein